MDVFDMLVEAYTEVEVAKAQANAAGKEHTQQKVTVERSNGAGITTEAPANPQQKAQTAAPVAPANTFNIGGLQVNKTLAIGGGSLLVVAGLLMFFKKK